MATDTLASALSNILNADRIGKQECLVRPISKLIKNILNIMTNDGFIGGYEEVDDGKGGYLKVKLLGAINKCGAIKPRFSIRKDGFEKFEKRYLPASNIGLILVSTPKGLMVHGEAKSKGLGGKLLAYVY